MKVNHNGSSNGNFSRSSSARSSARKSHNAILPKSSYSSPVPGTAPPQSPSSYHSPINQHQHHSSGSKSPGYHHQKSPTINYQSSPHSPLLSSSERNKSPKFHMSSSSLQTDHHHVFDFNQITNTTTNTTSPVPKSPRSPKAPTTTAAAFTSNSYDDQCSSSGSGGALLFQHSDQHNFDLQSPPKSRRRQQIGNISLYHRQQYQASKADTNSSKSSLEYQSTRKHPTGDYQDIEYKVCHSLDSDSLNSDTSINNKTKKKSTKESAASKPKCNIRTNPGYDADDAERYGSSKSIGVADGHQNPHQMLQRCRKSTSDLTDLTDDAGHTTMTSLSRPSSPRRKGSVKGGLAYLASRRGSRDSVASNMSNVSNEEDIGPLNFQNTARGRQRRTSNFLELPGKS